MQCAYKFCPFKPYSLYPQFSRNLWCKTKVTQIYGLKVTVCVWQKFGRSNALENYYSLILQTWQTCKQRQFNLCRYDQTCLNVSYWCCIITDLILSFAAEWESEVIYENCPFTRSPWSPSPPGVLSAMSQQQQQQQQQQYRDPPPYPGHSKQVFSNQPGTVESLTHGNSEACFSG